MTPPTHQYNWAVHGYAAGLDYTKNPHNSPYLIGGVMTPPYIEL